MYSWLCVLSLSSGQYRKNVYYVLRLQFGILALKMRHMDAIYQDDHLVAQFFPVKDHAAKILTVNC